jgi:hypothetical protein
MTKLFECKGCRQKRALVRFTKGLGYCEECSERAPTAEDFQNYMFPEDRAVWTENKRRRKFGVSRTYDKE